MKDRFFKQYRPDTGPVISTDVCGEEKAHRIAGFFAHIFGYKNPQSVDSFASSVADRPLSEIYQKLSRPLEATHPEKMLAFMRIMVKDPDDQVNPNHWSARTEERRKKTTASNAIVGPGRYHAKKLANRR